MLLWWNQNKKISNKKEGLSVEGQPPAWQQVGEGGVAMPSEQIWTGSGSICEQWDISRKWIYIYNVQTKGIQYKSMVKFIQ